MPALPTSPLAQWRAAEEAACAAERILMEDALAFVHRRGPAPPESQWQGAKRLREEADKRLELVTAQADQQFPSPPAAGPHRQYPSAPLPWGDETCGATLPATFQPWRASLR
jgi:hypothetical protein